MTKNVKVQSIDIQFSDGSTKRMSIEDARKLWKLLDDLFGITYAVPDRPIVIWQDQWPRWDIPSQPSDPLPLLPKAWCSSEYPEG